MSKDLDLHIKGEGTVFRDDKWGYPLYSLKLSNQFDGVWENKYINISLPKGQDVANKTKIIINDGFFTFFKTKTGDRIDKIIITSYDIAEEPVGSIDIPDTSGDDYSDDLPF